VATKLFFLIALSDWATANNDANLRGTAQTWNPLALATAAGAAANNTVATATVAGPTAGVEVRVGTPGGAVWYSPPLAAAVTISGSITWNIWGFESSASANVAINGRLEVIDGATGVITLIDATARTIEMPTINGAINFAETPAAGVACKKGDRLRVRIYGDDAGTMATGFSFVMAYNGPTAAANGDSWFQLTENLTFAAEPAGTQIFPTDTASAVSTASVDREAWTSRGGGVQTDVVNSVTGWTAPVQFTDTAGGTVVDWFTRPLTAFTLGGAVRVNVRCAASFGSISIRCEAAVVNGDGTSPVVWASGGPGLALAASEAASSFMVAGTDTAVTNGQRLRIRFSIDDVNNIAMTSGQTGTLYYAGAASATGDTYLTFTQALTEVLPTPPLPRRSVYPQVLPH